MMKNLGIVIRPGVEAALDVARDILEWCKEKGVEICLDSECQLKESEGVFLDKEALVQRCDYIVTLGGDGTLIGTARLSSEHSPLMIGVNFGTLGFLTEIAPDEVLHVLESVLRQDAPCGERSMLHAQVVRDGDLLFETHAINEVLVQKGSRSSLVDLDLFVGSKEVMRLRADGMIVATPTGSTAYSLAAGGSIVYPSLDIILVTPICPHSLTNRPLILPSESCVEISVPSYDGEIFISADGQESYSLQTGDRIRVTRSKNTVRFVLSSTLTYFDILREKLNWGRSYGASESDA